MASWLAAWQRSVEPQPGLAEVSKFDSTEVEAFRIFGRKPTLLHGLRLLGRANARTT